MRMKTVLVLLAVAVSVASGDGPLRGMFPKFKQVEPKPSNVTGDPLFVTPLIKSGKIKQAVVQSFVAGADIEKFTHSYAGYFTVNKPYCKSNLFFWFVPSTFNSGNKPVMLWLQGGPGGSSMFGLFNEHGPFSVNSKMRLIARKEGAWTMTHNMLYIDNPVGTGFSFTEKDDCYAKNQDDVANDLYEALVQFFTMFPNLRDNEFYVTGESYAGKYVPAITRKIHLMNPKAKLKINLKGMAIGDGMCDPVTMTNYGDFLFSVGLIDELDRDYFRKVSAMQVQLIKSGKFVQAFEVFDDLLNGDLSGHPSYFTNSTGFTYYFNYMMTTEPQDMGYYPTFLQTPVVRRALHVGNKTFNSGIVVEQHLKQDVMKSVKPWIEEILNAGYKALIYNGQMDVIIAWPLTESFLTSMKWKGAESYLKTKRQLWHVDHELAGYVKQVGNFTQAIVRNAGHMIPYDQPKWAHDLILRFTSGKKFQ